MKKRILCFGDSNTWGWNPGNTCIPPFVRWPDEVRWTGVLQALLGDGYEVINEGLNGRTTVWDDPIEEYRCGKQHIVPIMDTQAPLDLVILFVGTNDLKTRFGLTARDVAEGAGLLVNKALSLKNDFAAFRPNVLLVCPPRLGAVSETCMGPVFGGSEAKSAQLDPFYQIVARENGVSYLNADRIIHSSRLDGLHLDADQHKLLGEAMAVKVRELIG